jgi:hypothetical protein
LKNNPERRATLRLASGDDRGASGDLSELMRLEPDEPRFHTLRGDLRLKAQDAAGTIDDFKFASQLGETVTIDLRERPQPK